MILSKKTKNLLRRVMWVFIPAVLVFGLGVVFLNGYLIYRITRPPRTKLYGSPHDLQIITQRPMWSDEKWRNSDGTQSVGWFLSRGKPGPAIILSHAYGSNRSELLSLSFELWKAGYHVLVFDLRGHGESPVNWSGLGIYEKDDIVSAVKYLSTVKGDSGGPLVDGRIGLYGAELGGYSSLLAASQSPAIKAIAVDSVYPDEIHYVNYRLKDLVGTNTGWIGNLIDSPMTQRMTKMAMEIYLFREDASPASEAVRVKMGCKVGFIVGKDSGALGPMTLELYANTVDQKELIQVEKSRIGRLYETDAASYDATVVKYFVQAIPPSK